MTPGRDVGDGEREEREAPAPDRTPRLRRDRRPAVLIGVLTALLGFAIAVQLRSASTQDALAGARQDDLVRILDDQNSRAARLRARIAEQEALLQRLTAAGGDRAAAEKEARRQADALAILNGTVPVTGPGVVVTITDPRRQLHSEDLLDVIEELRGAGAEAIQFGPVRVGTSSYFADARGAVTLDTVTLIGPYTVLAIGDPPTLDTALNIPGGVAAVVRTAGGQASVNQRNRIDITAVRAIAPHRYAVPVPR